MSYTRYFLNGSFLFWISIVDIGYAKSNVPGQIPNLSLISSLVDMFLKPYLKTLDIESKFRVSEETAVEKIVREKLEQLTPLLQDNDFNTSDAENVLKLDGNDETTIIEFLPEINREPKPSLRNDNNTFKVNMQRYKKIRSKIDWALKNELVSEKTKTLVMNSFDELLSKMIETQCNWKEETDEGKQNYFNKIVIPRTIVNTWNEEWQKLKLKFSSLTTHRANGPMDNLKTLMLHLNNLDHTINDISENIRTFSDKYRINCKVSERKYNKKNLSNNKALKSVRYIASMNEEDNDSICKHFKVCSKELKSFFLDFYNALNETTLNVVRNYAEMFTRDVYTDASNEKDSIVIMLFNFGDDIEKEIIEIFVNCTSQFELDSLKGSKANIYILTKYVKEVVRHVKRIVTNSLEIKLSNIPKKVYKSIYQDISLNLGVELGNLERDLIGKICFIFNVCNDNTKSRRTNDNDIDRHNKIFVKIELTIDDELEDSLKNKTLLKSPKVDVSNSIQDASQDGNLPTTLLDYKKYAKIIVTRTTTL